MDKREILRRLAVLIAMPAGVRPISIYRLTALADVGKDTIYTVLERNTMTETTRAKLARALSLVENDQVTFKRANGKVMPDERTGMTIQLRAPRKTQATVRRVVFTKDGPKVIYEAVNPLAFPKFDKWPPKGR